MSIYEALQVGEMAVLSVYYGLQRAMMERKLVTRQCHALKGYLKVVRAGEEATLKLDFSYTFVDFILTRV